MRGVAFAGSCWVVPVDPGAHLAAFAPAACTLTLVFSCEPSVGVVKVVVIIVTMIIVVLIIVVVAAVIIVPSIVIAAAIV